MLSLVSETLLTVEVPGVVADDAGLIGTAKVNVVVVGAATTVKVPLYSVCVAPDNVTMLPAVRPCTAVVVAVAVSVAAVAASLEAAARVSDDRVKVVDG